MVVGEGKRLIKAFGDSLGSWLPPPFSLTSGNNVRLCNENAHDALEALLQRQYTGQSSVTVHAGDHIIYLTRIERGLFHKYVHGLSVIVLCHRVPAIDLKPRLADYARSVHLTPAEHRVLTRILAGNSIRDIAAEAGLSKETIRTQAKSVYAKCGTPNRSIILRQVLNLPI
nr:LuxR family transcriptional regulator [Aureimonas altamirensis]